MRLPADVPRAIDYSFAGLVPHSNESWPAALAKRWSEVDVRFPVAHALCLPDVCRADFIADVVKNGKLGGFPYVISFVIIFCFVVFAAYEPLQKLDFGVGYCQTRESVQKQPFHWPAALIFAW